MDFSVYGKAHIFELRRSKRRETVGGDAILRALFTGPYFFWKRGAMMEAVVLGVLTLPTLPLWVVDTESYHLEELGGLVWLVASFLAPALLAGSYRRRGWVDVTDGPPALADVEDRAPDKPSHREEEEGLRLPPRRGRLLDLQEDDLDGPEAPVPAPVADERPRLPRGGRRLLDLEDEEVAVAPADDHQGLTLPPRRGRRFLDMTEEDLD